VLRRVAQLRQGPPPRELAPNGCTGAGAALARGESADATGKLAASDVTALGRGKRAAAVRKPTSGGGRGVAAVFLRARSADRVRQQCKNADAAGAALLHSL